MTVAAGARLQAEAAPDDAALERAAASDPENPFLTPAFARAERRGDKAIALLSLHREGERPSCCLAGTKRGRLHTTVEVFSLPEGGDSPEFAEGLLRFCRAEGADLLVVDSLGSRARGLPPLGGRIEHRARWEHVWALQGRDLWSGLSVNHRRNVTRARKAGVVVEAAAGDEALRTHLRLGDASLLRREQRGERVPTGDLQASSWGRLLEAGAGCLFQARLGEEALSSILLLRARDGAYYHSAGTSPEGMRLGASQLLIFEVATRLGAEGLSVFNLGGAEPINEGLYRFKVGFGTGARELEAASYQVGSAVRRGVLWLAESARAVFSRS